MNQTQLNIVTAFEAGYRVVGGKVISPRGNVRRVHKNKAGYFQFGNRINGKVRPIEVHRLVAFEKFGDRIFEAGIQVRHLNSVCTNNFHYNIDIGTPSDNCNDKPKEERLRSGQYASSFIKIHNHDEIIRRRNEGAKYKDLMQEFGISSKGTVDFILLHSNSSKRTA
jgi:hypothetical protein